MDTLNKEKILKLTGFHTNIEIKETTTSTNDDIKRLADNLNQPYVLIANHQSQGKGRNGKSFYSPKGSGIYMSIFIKPDLNISDSLKISACISVAVVNAIKEIYKLQTQIKWINDIYYHNKKLAGILCESSLKPNSNQLDYMIVGVGINVHKYSFPPELSEIVTTIENNTNLIKDRNDLIASTLNHFYDLYKNINHNTFLEEYKKYSCLINKEINVITSNQTYKALVLGINDKAELIIKKDNKIINLSSGEISIRKL